MALHDELTEAAVRFKASFVPSEMGPAPRRHVTVLACMDARLDLFRLLGLDIGDAHILRNAGGLLTDDAVRSLVLSQRALGTRHTVLIHHTDCGLQKITDEVFVAELERDTGQRPPWRPGAFTDPFEDVRRAITTLRDCPWLLSHSVEGYVFDVETGDLLRVDADG